MHVRFYTYNTHSVLFRYYAQIHAYTQRRGRISFSNFKRAFIFEDGNIDPDTERIFGTFQRREVDENVFVPYLTSLHILLQVAIGLTIMKLIPSYYSSVSQGKEGKKVKKNSPSVSIFWANVFFASAIDVFFVGIDLYLIVSVYGGVDSAIDEIITSSNRSTLETVFAFGMLGTLVTFTMVSIQFFVAAGIPKITELHIPGVLRVLCCFFPCRCRKLDGDFWRKALQTFAIWSLMVFLQLVAGSVIPYLVLAIVNPVPSVTFLALGASTLFCLIIFVASLIHIGVQLKKSSCYEKIVTVVQGLVFIVFLGLVAITVIIYQGVIQSGTSTGFVSGIALSLIPSGIIAVLGVAVKFKLLSDTDDDDQEHQDESLLTRATSLLRHRLSTRRTKDKGYQKDKALDSSDVTPSDHPETENGVDMNKPHISHESQGDGISNDEKLDHNHTPIKKNLSISEVNLIECGEDETDSGNGSGSDTKESGIIDPSIEAKSKSESPETKLDDETSSESGNDSSSSKKEPDFKDPSTTSDVENKPEPEPEVHINETAVEVVSIDFTDFDNIEKQYADHAP